MGIAVLILGASGTGKSASMRNFKKGEVGVFNVANKPLPFKGELDTVSTYDYNKIEEVLRKNTLKTYIIDDSQYLMAFANFQRAYEKGYDKFTQFAVDFKLLLDTITWGTSNDTVVYLLHHTETTETGAIKAKTIGKMLDQQLTVEGLFSVVLLATTDGEHYKFITNGQPPAKSPIGMFEQKEIDNDLKAVDETIREYWNLKATKKETK
jgi:hypothetical protein